MYGHSAGFRQVTLSLFDGRIVVAPYPPCSELFAGLAFAPDPGVVPASVEENYYQFYFSVGWALQPETYLEIGTRFGYSMIAVARGASGLSRIVSCDLQSYDNPHGLPSQQIAEKNLRSAGYTRDATFLADDSRRLLSHIAGETFDLIHVDGDHSFDGACHDIRMCFDLLKPGGTMLIDDVDQPEVLAAVDRCVEDLGVAERDRGFVPTKHGLSMIRRRA